MVRDIFFSSLISSLIFCNVFGTEDSGIKKDYEDMFKEVPEEADQNEKFDLWDHLHVLGNTKGSLDSFSNLSYWAQKEEKVYIIAKQRLKDLQLESKMFKEYIDDYESSTKQAIESSSRRPLESPEERAELIASSGIAAYRMTYRYVHNLQEIKRTIQRNIPTLSSLIDELEIELSQDNESFVQRAWPNRVDLSYAMHSLIHIQETYRQSVSPDKLASFLAPETTQPVELTAFHSGQIGMYALFQKHFSEALEWLSYALKQAETEDDLSIPIPLLETYAELAIEMHNQWKSKANPVGNLNNNLVNDDDEYLIHGRLPEEEALDDNEFMKEIPHQNDDGRTDEEIQKDNFKNLCSGTQVSKSAHNLYCWYDKTTKPERAIAPFKLETLSESPEIYLAHDFLSDKIVEQFLSLTKPNLSVLHGDETNVEVSRRGQTPSNSFADKNDPFVLELERRIEDLTQTELTEEGSTENFILVHYGYGRFIGPHNDAFRDPEMDHVQSYGERLIAVILYLTEAKIGGETVFTNLGLSIKPKRGSVLWWKNLYKNGTIREDTWHGSCPVTYGFKESSTQVIRYNSQFRTLPCSLNQFE